MRRFNHDVIVRVTALSAGVLMLAGGLAAWSTASGDAVTAPARHSNPVLPTTTAVGASVDDSGSAPDTATSVAPAPGTAGTAGGTAFSDAPSLAPPAVGQYTYRVNASDGDRSSRADAVLSVGVGADDQERRTILTFAGASVSRLERWKLDAVVRVEQLQDGGETCRWEPSLLLMQGPIFSGATWSTQAACDTPTGRQEWTEEARITGAKSVRVGEDVVEVVVIERTSTRRTGRLVERVVTIDEFAPSLGLSTTTASDVTSVTATAGGEEVVTSRRLVAELVRIRPRPPAA